MKILVTGGSGLVGKHLKNYLPDAIYLNSKYDLRDWQKTVEIFEENNNIDCVIHLAAKVGGIHSNMTYPVEYLQDNILINTNLLRACHLYNINKVIALSSSCCYPASSDVYPMAEESMYSGMPEPTNLGYAYAKRAMGLLINYYRTEYKKNWCYLTPCNLYGEYDKFDESHSHFVSALLKKIYYAEDSILLMGNGTSFRQFMYADDIVKAINLILTEQVLTDYNIATQENLSIYDIANIAIKSCGKPDLKINFDNVSPNGVYRKDITNNKFMGRFPDFKFTPLSVGLTKTYNTLKDLWK